MRLEKSRKKSKRQRRQRRRRSNSNSKNKYKYSNSDRGLGECKGKKKIVCLSDPNCVKTKVVCRRRPKKAGSKRLLYYGPILKNN